MWISWPRMLTTKAPGEKVGASLDLIPRRKSGGIGEFQQGWDREPFC